MDKDLLRLVILGMGGVLIVGIILWGYLANRKSRRPVNFYDQRNPLDNIDESLIIKTGDDDFDIVPLGSAVADEIDDLSIDEGGLAKDQPPLQERTQQDSVPKIIQLSIVAKSDAGFEGMALVNAFETIGLKHSEAEVFQRLDANGLPDYAVASMVEPGTFPRGAMAEFNCPGIVFFMQPSQLNNSLEVFDDMIKCIEHLATVMDGKMWDSNRQDLTIQTIQDIREKLIV